MQFDADSEMSMRYGQCKQLSWIFTYLIIPCVIPKTFKDLAAAEEAAREAAAPVVTASARACSCYAS